MASTAFYWAHILISTSLSLSFKTSKMCRSYQSTPLFTVLETGSQDTTHSSEICANRNERSRINPSFSPGAPRNIITSSSASRRKRTLFMRWAQFAHSLGCLSVWRWARFGDPSRRIWIVERSRQVLWPRGAVVWRAGSKCERSGCSVLLRILHTLRKN